LRSSQEIAFRLRQELANFGMFLRPPQLTSFAEQTIALPDVAAVARDLHSTDYAAEVVTIADAILDHRFPLLGLVIHTGTEIDWRRDPVHRISTGTPYFRCVPYLDFPRVGDHKIVWELNRHQHLVALAQAYRITGRTAYREELERQISSWIIANPFLRGINWASALEVAFRALAWIWVWHLIGPPSRRFEQVLFAHGCYLEKNLSIYFSPNTHLLGEAVGLHALGMLFPGWPQAARWREMGRRIVHEQIGRQVRPDGSHFEQSVYYHVYALDFFLFDALLEDPPAEYKTMLCRMAEYLAALTGPSGILPLFGDDDGGRMFHPFGERTAFGRATLAACGVYFERREWIRSVEDLYPIAAWWMGDRALNRQPGSLPRPRSRLFPHAGMAVMENGDAQIIIKAGPFGEGSGGHSHSDVLSLVARLDDEELLIDPGTFTYVGNAEERNRFRGTAAHNTIRIDGRDQAEPAGPFRWIEKPDVEIVEWTGNYLDAACRYRGFVHRRRVLLLDDARALVVLDEVSGPAGGHMIEQFWHLAGSGALRRLAVSHDTDTIEGWRSPAFGRKIAAPVVRALHQGTLPVRMAAVIDLSRTPAPGVVDVRVEGDQTLVAWDNEKPVTFPLKGVPH
jgi:hypothetical protein